MTLLGILLAAADPALAADPLLLTNATQVRALSQEAAARSLAVCLQGVVVVEAESGGSGFVVLDDTEAIYVEGAAPLVSQLRRRDWVEVEGVSDPGGFAPTVRLQKFRKLGQRRIPEPQRVTFEQLIGSRFDAQWIEVAGIVRSCEPVAPNAQRTAIELATGGQRLAVRINKVIPPGSYVDAEVRLRGVCFNQHTATRQFVNPLLHIPRDEEIIVDQPAPPDPFAGPVTSIANLLQFAPDGNYGHRALVRGVVTHHRPGERLWLREGERGLRVRTRQTDSLRPGEVVEVLGFPNRGGYSPIMEDAIYRKRGAGPPPAPSLLTDLASASHHDGDLVQFEALLAEIKSAYESPPASLELTLNWSGETIEASLELERGETLPENWRPGSLVRATGICIITAHDPAPPTGVLQPRLFQLLLRDPQDLVVLKPPAWWTAERRMWTASAVAVALLLTVTAVVFAARRRLREQAARRAMAEAEFSAILSERNRMAREIHDTLAQGLVATSVQLELAKGDLPAAPDSVMRHLEQAHQLVRSSLQEARNSIWNMRSQVLESGDLGSALEGILRQLSEGLEVKASMQIQGRTRRLPPVSENHLLRAGQEAITNATRHARAKNLEVTLDFADKHVRLTVRDDGVGFDAAKPPPGEGGFGLVGMRERAEQLHGELRIQSAPGKGTTITLSIPVPG